MEDEIAKAQANFEAGPTPRHRAEINKNIAEYILLLKMEEDFWRQKAALRWLAEGDRNSRFYQSWVKQKRVKLRIHSIYANGQEITDEDEIRKSAVELFQGLLAPDNPVPDLDEVKRALFEISGDSAPGPDGFSATFYQACWPIVGRDVVEAIAQFFNGAYLPRSVTATNIVLIPKKASPETWADYRPISLCNVFNKIITKVLTARLAPYLPQVISPNQSGFVKGRLLNDNVLLAQEMFHEIARCSPAPNVAIKIDMAKAYDMIQWDFLIKVLCRMGFPEAWISLIERCVGSCWFSVLMCWDEMCCPTNEGGLGIRKFKDVLRAFNIKLWWRFREQTSLWARYMMCKYCSTSSPLTTKTSGRSSPTWKRLTRAWAQAHPHIRWIVGAGRIYFWDDIWLGNEPLRGLCIDDRGSPSTPVAEFIKGGAWDEPKLQLLHDQAGLPQKIVTDILNTPILSGEPDIPRWTLSRRGEFSLASTWEALRVPRPIIQRLEDIWKAGLTTTIPIFIWRLLSNRIPVDSKLQWRKIELASKCQCCPHRPHTESLQHLFIQGVGASKVWREFDGWFEGSSPPLRINDTIPTRLEVWGTRLQQPGRKHLSRLMPYLNPLVYLGRKE
ncbi:uncharacterized protein LOC121770454 [Salvia splendens]|uniref:uncharacterized protein LOC121770454 n=1 Tax=Salvia splendens TaxID=180675 RepID=UPI001C277145|nr:uncharacterized protein LOC121770454 [Salvia splendens]